MNSEDKKPCINIRREKFVMEYLICLNATEAYIKAGYHAKSKDVARKAASRLLTNVDIRQYILILNNQNLQETELNARNVLKELSLIAFSDITDCFEFQEKGRVRLKDYNEIPNETSRAIKYYKKTKNGFAVKMQDKDRALKLLGNHFGLYNDKVSSCVLNNNRLDPSIFSDDELINNIMLLEQELIKRQKEL